MSTSAATNEKSAPAAAKLPRRIWFPLVWPLVLAGICFWAWHFFDDQGVTNSMIHGAAILTVVGWALWVIRRSGWERATRWTIAAVLILLLASHYLQFSPWEVVNNGDVGIVDIRWRWAEPDRELAAAAVKPAVALDWQTTPQDYPKFLGNGYWAEVAGVALDPDWETRPPQEKWKQRIGAGWSAFAVVGNYGVTQEQQGDQELMTCYDIRTGQLLWAHADPVRFDPRGGGSFGGIGPRATPTIFDGRVYSHGATGVFNCLDAATGELLWSHDTCADFDVENLIWGKAASPLIVDDMVLVSVGDSEANILPKTTGKGNSLVAYDRVSGEVVWTAGDRRSAYATPVLTPLAGVEQVIVVNEDFITSHDAADGKVLWEHPWPGKSDADASSSQPVPVGDDRLFFSKGYGVGSELVQVSHDGKDWRVEPIWKRTLMKTKMCNVVIRDGYVYSLDEVNLECIELATGKPQWKKRRSPSFGHGQVLLVGEHLLVTTEEGEVILVAVDPAEYRELGHFQAIEGVTWNNPTLVGPLLLVRNAEWAACFELPLQSRTISLVAPRGVEARAIGATSIQVTWEASLNATDYLVARRNPSTETEYTVIAPNVVGTSYTDSSGLLSDTLYEYVVVAQSSPSSVPSQPAQAPASRINPTAYRPHGVYNLGDTFTLAPIFDPFRKRAVRGQDENSTTLGPGIRINYDDDDGDGTGAHSRHWATPADSPAASLPD